MIDHKKYMYRVLELAEKGWGRTNPNPLVGCLIVKNGSVIAEGFHRALGAAHAEVNAMQNAEESVEGATLYVNLEPCSHYGRTPPCAKAIIEAGIREVVIAMTDPNPKVSGRGIQMLREAGILVTTGILEEEARKLNEIFVTYISKKKPFVILKSAMSLDGKIATSSGDSKWITGENARRYVHHLRDRVAGIMVGIKTIMTDNPQLTTRLDGKEGKHPIRIIVDSQGKIPLDRSAISKDLPGAAILATTTLIDKEKEKAIEDKGVGILKTDPINGRVNLKALMDELYRREIDSILLEGGGSLNYSALESGIVDKVLFFVAPKILGGENAITPVEGQGKNPLSEAFRLKDMRAMSFDPDILIEAYMDEA